MTNIADRTYPFDNDSFKISSGDPTRHNLSIFLRKNLSSGQHYLNMPSTVCAHLQSWFTTCISFEYYGTQKLKGQTEHIHIRLRMRAGGFDYAQSALPEKVFSQFMPNWACLMPLIGESYIVNEQ